MARIVYDNPSGLLVNGFVCGVHNTGLVVSYDESVYKGPTAPFPNGAVLGAYRWYGAVGHSQAHIGNNQFDWTDFDAGATRLRNAGITKWQWTAFNPPGWMCTYANHPYGNWSMQLPNSYSSYRQWLRALFDRYQEFKYLEVCNEIFDSVGVAADYWYAPGQTNTQKLAELTTLANWSLDIVAEYNVDNPTRNIEVWAPSIPGFIGNDATFFAWLDTFARRAEFSAYPLHCYGLKGDYVGEYYGPNTNYTCLREYKEALAARGITKPMIDGEKGMYFNNTDSPSYMAAQLYNAGVAEVCYGVRQLFWFHWTHVVSGADANIGRPFEVPEVAQALNDLQALGGQYIKKVTDNQDGSRYVVEFVPIPNGPIGTVTVSPPQGIIIANGTTTGGGLATIQHRGTTTAALSLTTTPQLTKPAGVVQNDVMYGFLCINSLAITVTPPAGWTLVDAQPSIDTNKIHVYRKVAGASEPANYTWTLSAQADAVVGAIVAHFNEDTAAPQDGYAYQQNNTWFGAATCPSLTPTGTGRMLLCAGIAAVWPRVFSPPSGMTERVDLFQYGTNAHPSLSVNEQLLTGAGATGAKDIAMDDTERTVGMSILIKPATTASGTSANGGIGAVVAKAPIGSVSVSGQPVANGGFPVVPVYPPAGTISVGGSSVASGPLRTVSVSAPAGSINATTTQTSVWFDRVFRRIRPWEKTKYKKKISS